MSNRSMLLQYKGNRCASCGLSVLEMLERYGTFERMFEFHHVDPTSKDKHYQRLMAQRLSRRQIDEMDKCVLLCRQCHGTLHAQNIRAELTLTIDFRGRIASQKVEGWVRLDRVSGKINFVTNQPYVLHPCRIKIPGRPDQLLTLGEASAQVWDWIRQIKSMKQIEVYRLRDEKLVFSMSHIASREVAFRHLIEFPLMTIEYHEQEKSKEVIFLRNGFALMKSGDVLSSGTVGYTLSVQDEIPLDD